MPQGALKTDRFEQAQNSRAEDTLANNKSQAGNIIDFDFTPSSAADRNTGSVSKLCRAKVKQSELVIFTTQLSVMLDSGVVLSDALDAIAEQTVHDVFRNVIEEVSETVKNGQNFSKALLRYPRVFNPMFVSMVKASEASGKMAEMLRVLSGYLDFEIETKKQIKGALTYPLIMALTAVAATGTLMFFVLPRFTKIYESRGTALPKLTQMLVNFSSILGDADKMITISMLLVGAGIGLYYFASTAFGRRVIDYAKIRTPIFGTMYVDAMITRGMRIMATMVNTGVGLLDCLEVIKNSSSNSYFQHLWGQADEKIRDGYQLSESIQLCETRGLIAPGIVQMLRAGEKSGKLGYVCDKVSVFYEKKLQTSIKSAMTLMEPLMITILGGIIGTIAIALLMPVFRVSSVISH